MFDVIGILFRMNRLDVLPRGFGAFPVLEVLDLTYNNLKENSLPANFFQLGKSNLVPVVIVVLYRFYVPLSGEVRCRYYLNFK